MTSTADEAPASQTVPLPSAPAGEVGLDRDAIGLGRSTVFALAGSAPGQTISIVLAPLVAAAAYGTILPILATTAGLLCVAYSFHKLNEWKPNAGATYEWVSRAANPYLGFIIGWIMLVAFAAFILIDVITIAPGIISVLGLPDNNWSSAVLLVLFGGMITFAAARGIRLSAGIQLAVAIIEYSILAIFSVWAFIAVFIVHKSGTLHPSSAWFSFHGVAGAGSFSAATVIAVASIAGWDGGIYLNEETEAPEKNPGRGALLGVLLMGVFFLVMFTAFQGIASGKLLQDNASNALALVGQRLGGDLGMRVLSFAVVLSVLATTQVAIIGAARVVFAMSRDRVLPARLATISPRYRTPAITTVIIGAGAVVLSVLDLFATSIANALETLINVSGFLYAVFYATTAVAATWFYRRVLARSVRTAIVLGVLPIGGAALIGWVAFKGAQAFSSTEVWSLAGVGVVGVVLMFVAKFRNRAPIFDAPRESAG